MALLQIRLLRSKQHKDHTWFGAYPVHWSLSLIDKQEKIEHWPQEYNGYQPYSSLQNLTPDEVVANVELQNARYSTFNRLSKWEEVKNA
jgi:hypothetical protein